MSEKPDNQISTEEKLSKDYNIRESGLENLLEQDEKLNSSVLAEALNEINEEYKQRTLRQKSKELGSKVVTGFVEHDLKSQQGFIKNVGQVYEKIARDPNDFGRDSDGYAAARHHIGALKAHDIIEDGVEEVMEKYGEKHITPRTRRKAERQEKRGMPKLFNPMWEEYVEPHFVEMALNLGLPKEQSERFGRENKEFYRRHTGVHEDSDEVWNERTLRGSEDRVMQKRIYEHFAKEAQKTMISGLTGLDREQEKVENLAIEFIKTVNSHDAHTREDQLENIERMGKYYNKILDEILSMREA